MSKAPDVAPVSTWWRVRNSWWLLLPLLGCSCLGGTGLLYLGLRTRRPAWWIPGLVYLLLGIAAFAVIGETERDNPLSDVAVWVLLLVWMANIMHACLINSAWLRWRAERRRRATVPATTWLPGPYHPVGPYQPGSGPVGPYEPGAFPSGPFASGPFPVGPSPSGGFPVGGFAPPPNSVGGPYQSGPVAAPIVPPAGVGAPVATPAPATGPLDVNQVEFDQLVALPSFDPLRARHVLAERQVRRGFGSMAEFAAVANLAPHEYAPLRTLLTCGPAPVGPASPGATPRSGTGPPVDPTAESYPGSGSYPGGGPGPGPVSYPGAGPHPGPAGFPDPPPTGRVLDV